jgi:nicotinamide-nucleotide amidase
MNIAILTIGDELLNGDLADTNTAAIAGQLASHSLPAQEAATVGDDETAIAAALQRLAASHDAIIVTGGLGPTEDDRTARAAAIAFNRPLSLDQTALQQIRERFHCMQRRMHPANEKQAMLPGRSRVIANRNGTAPGFHLQHLGSELFFLPGVPREMLAMLDEYVVPMLQERFPAPPLICQQTITVLGLPEPEVESRIVRGTLPEGVELAFNVELPVVQVKLRARGEQARKRVDRAEEVVRRALGEHVVSSGSETLAAATGKLLRSAGLSLALAESCTGGLIAKLLTDQAGASAFLERSVVSYANSAKIDCLHVPEELLARHGAVSEACAVAMARGVKTVSRADIGLAVTGIAGPDGGTEDKPVGTVFIALDGPYDERAERFLFPGNREQVRMRTACTALDWLRRQAMQRISGLAEEE